MARFCGLRPGDAEEVAAFALDQLCREVERGRPITSPAGYAWTTAVRQGKRVHDRLPRFATDQEVAGAWVAGIEDDLEDGQDVETLRLVRTLIPRISQEDAFDLLRRKERAAQQLLGDPTEAPTTREQMLHELLGAAKRIDLDLS